jgi:hypothetical protein
MNNHRRERWLLVCGGLDRRCRLNVRVDQFPAFVARQGKFGDLEATLPWDLVAWPGGFGTHVIDVARQTGMAPINPVIL